MKYLSINKGNVVLIVKQSRYTILHNNIGTRKSKFIENYRYGRLSTAGVCSLILWYASFQPSKSHT